MIILERTALWRLSPLQRRLRSGARTESDLVGKAAGLASGRSGELWLTHKVFTRVRSHQVIPISDPVRQLTDALRGFIQEVENSELDDFWHRKSQRVVLAMLHVVLPDGTGHFVPGINTEVSLPTGSICAERAAITSARSQWVGLRREHMKGVAVVDVPLPGSREVGQLQNPLPPCGACVEWLQKIQEASQSFYVVTYSDLSLQEVHERYMYWHHTQETVAPPEFGPWHCRLCGARNVPLSSQCAGCHSSRFSFSYNRAPDQQQYRWVLDTLHHHGPLDETQLWEKLSGEPTQAWLPASKASLSKILQRLLNNERKGSKGEILGKIVRINSRKRYQLTEVGQKMLEDQPRRSR